MMRNPLHSICPYFAMFPETFVQDQLLAYSRPGDTVFDPFVGRGTTVLESLLNGRKGIGSDINPVAACVAGAKADIPSLESVQERIESLRRSFAKWKHKRKPLPDFFELCFSASTLKQVLFLRESLSWRRRKADRFIAAMMLGILHGESHKTPLCLSNRMPRTISTKPDYSVRWWQARSLLPPDRDAFSILMTMAHIRLGGQIPEIKGKVVLGDARRSSHLLRAHRESVALIVTSPPYLDTTDYAEDQWLRLWFLGGPAHPTPRLHKDDRHTQVDRYWTFLREVWAGSAALLAKQSFLVVRIGGAQLEKGELMTGLKDSLDRGFPRHRVKPLHSGETSAIRRRQTNSFRPGTSPQKVEHDFAFELVR